MGLPLDTVLDLVRALGYTRPLPEDRVREDDSKIFALMRVGARFLDHDALIRMTLSYVDAMRRLAEIEASLFDAYVVGSLSRLGLGFAESYDLANQFAAESTPHQEALIVTLCRREQERRWTQSTVEGIERVLEDMGLYRSPQRPPAFAFVDLVGYTALTEERGDEAGARLAAEMRSLVDDIAGGHGGVPIKWLGDGVMVYFRDAADALDATLEMVARSPETGLPAHAGVATGPAVFQDGDYFGRTVNLAARVAGEATAGQTLVSGDTETYEVGETATLREFGSIELQGFSTPIVLYEARRADTPKRTR